MSSFLTMKNNIKRVSVVPEVEIPLTAASIMQQMKEHVVKVTNTLNGLKKAFNISKEYAPPTLKS
jgi:hypothetical protein